MTPTAARADWQCVMIAWGEKYGAPDINRIVRGVRRHSDPPPRFLLISDRPREGLDAAVEVIPYVDWWLKEEFRRGSCQAKLVMFEAGVLPDAPTVFVDLDTAILGDLSRAIDLMRTPRDVWMLQSVVLPFGWPGRLVYRLTGGRRYARGNSSVVVFRPGECGDIAERFRQLYERHGGLGIRPMISDERFISWAAQMRAHALPRDVAVKFPNEYMHPWRWVLRLRGLLPWVRARRRAAAAVTLPGPAIKPEELLDMAEGTAIRDPKGRWLLWDRQAMGDMGARLQTYFS